MHRFRRSRGFTLIELVLVVVLLGLGTAVMAPVLFELTEAMVFDIMRRDLVKTSRHALDMIRHELQMVQSQKHVFDIVNLGGIVDVEDIAIMFRDTNGAGVIKQIARADPDATLNLAGTRLIMWVGTAPGDSTALPQPLSPNDVTDFSITYYDKDGATIDPANLILSDITAQPAAFLRTNIRSIRVDVTFESPNLNATFGGNYPYHLQTQITPENLQ